MYNVKFVNTSGTCFLCSKMVLTMDCEDDEEEENAEEAKLFNFRLICNNFNINAAKCLGGGTNDSGFSAIVCSHCHVVAERLSKLCEELELIRFKLKDALVSFHGLLSPVDIPSGNCSGGGAIVDLLRKETERRCKENLNINQTSRLMTTLLPLEKCPTEHIESGSQRDSIPIVTTTEKLSPKREVSQEMYIPLLEDHDEMGTSSYIMPDAQEPNDTMVDVGPDPQCKRKCVNILKRGTSLLWRHEIVAAKSKASGHKYHCNFCPSSFSGGTSKIRYHIISVHLEKLFPACKLAHVTDEEFLTCCKLSLEEYKSEMHTEDKDGVIFFKCQYCTDVDMISSADKRVMENHALGEHCHLLAEKLERIQQQKDILDVEDMVEQFQALTKFKRRNKYYNCVKCGKRFAAKCSLKRHKCVSVRLQEKGDYTCDPCTLKFASKERWLQHVKSSRHRKMSNEIKQEPE